MDKIICRQCGQEYSRTDFPTGHFHCSSCDWKEMLPPIPARPVNSEVPVKAEAHVDNPPPETEVEPAVEAEPEAASDEAVAEPIIDGDWTRVLQSSPEDFTLWCERFVRMFGFSMVEMDSPEERDCDLELTRNGETRFVDCRHLPDGESVSRGEAQKLAGAMIGRRVTRGALITSGTFDDGCRSYVAGLPDLSIDLIDGSELQETLQAITSGPLRKWWL
jgi:hypothetical protein